MLLIKFVQDLDTAKSILKPTSFMVYKIKSNIIWGMLKKIYPKKERFTIKGGFEIHGEGTDYDIKKELKRLEDFMLGSSGNAFEKLRNDRDTKKVEREFKRKFSDYSAEKAKKMLGDKSVLQFLNNFGIMITWEVTKPELE